MRQNPLRLALAFTLAMPASVMASALAADTVVVGGGFIPDLVDGSRTVFWRLGPDFATSDDLPGIRIPNASFPGVVTTLPGPDQLTTMLARETALAATGARVFGPET